ncbi:carbohydrate ABC transporter permease [Thalassobacillus sp. C254]|uniref:carbohydrate ABC transporter permease n=1 Tax=Thalassobacillus sp. C254 TaxID=1225341 RepID=UPI0018DB3AFA|nr:sugar ABC transporter permease [Thalassobacillus sp. C254]
MEKRVTQLGRSNNLLLPRLIFKKSLFKYLFLLPALLYVLIFMIYPIAYNIILSFQDVTLMNLGAGGSFIGIENYVQVLQNPLFLTALGNTLIYTVSCIVLQFGIGFLLALFFNQDFPF